MTDFPSTRWCSFKMGNFLRWTTWILIGERHLFLVDVPLLRLVWSIFHRLPEKRGWRGLGTGNPVGLCRIDNANSREILGNHVENNRKEDRDPPWKDTPPPSLVSSCEFLEAFTIPARIFLSRKITRTIGSHSNPKHLVLLSVSKKVGLSNTPVRVHIARGWCRDNPPRMTVFWGWWSMILHPD